MFFALIRAEWIKTMRMRSTYIAFVAAGVLVLLTHAGMQFTASKSDIYIYLTQHKFSVSLLVNSYTSTRIALEAGFVMLLAPMVIQIFARQVAGEDLRGTLRLILSRPISRWSLLNAKFIVCAIYCLMLMGFTLAMSMGIGLMLYGPHDSMTVGKFSELDDDRFQDEAQAQVKKDPAKAALLPPDAQRRILRQAKMNLRDRWLATHTISQTEGTKRIFIAWLLTSWALLTIGAIAFFYSVINKHPIAAMAMTIGTLFIAVILQMMSNSDNILPLFKALKPYLFTTAMDYWRDSMSYEVRWDSIRWNAALLGSYTLGFFVVAQIIFWRKDITS